MIKVIYLVEAESVNGGWTPVSFCLTQEAADLAIDSRHKAEGCYQINYRVREFIPEEA